MTAIRRLLLAGDLLVAVAPARGQEGEGSAPPAAGAIAFRPVVERVVAGVRVVRADEVRGVVGI